MKGKLTVGVFLLLALGVSASWAQPRIVGTEELFRLDWEATRDRGGRPVVQGYVYNMGRYQADRMQMRVEALDDAGRVVRTTTGYVAGTIPAGQRAYFVVDIPAAQTYRIQVQSFEWSRCGDG